MQVNLTYVPVQGSPSSTPMNFRIFYYTLATSNLNSLLWSPRNSIVTAGNNTLTIYPRTSVDILPNNVTFKIEAYYGNNMQSFYDQKVPFDLKAVYPMKNPTLSYPTYSSPEIYPSWNLTTSGSNTITSYEYGLYGINLRGNHTATDTGPTYSNLSTVLNLTMLAKDNFSLSYDYHNQVASGNYNTVVTNGRMVSFFGIVISLSQNSKFLWFGYNSTASGSAGNLFSYQELNSSSYIVESNSTLISFAQAAKIAEQMPQWNVSLNTVTFSVVASVNSSDASYSVFFSNFTLYENGSTVISPFLLQGSYYSNESINYGIGISEAVIPAADSVRIE